MSSGGSVCRLAEEPTTRLDARSPIKPSRLLAEKYQKYCNAQREKQGSQRNWSSVLFERIQCAQRACELCWLKCIPVAVRGPVTPLQAFREALAREGTTASSDALVTARRLTQTVLDSQQALLLTYAPGDASNLLKMLLNSQNLSLISQSNVPLLPIRIDSRHPQIEERRIKEILTKNLPSRSHRELALLVRKGLFDQIIVLEFFEITDPQLYQKVMVAIDQRQIYELSIKKMADQVKDRLSMTLVESINPGSCKSSPKAVNCTTPSISYRHQPQTLQPDC